MALVHPALLSRCIREYLSPAIRSRVRNPEPRRQNRPHGHALFDWHRLVESYPKAGGNEAPHAGRRAVGNSRNRIATRNQIRPDRDLTFDALNLLGDAEPKARDLRAPWRRVNQFDAPLTARNRAVTLLPPSKRSRVRFRRCSTSPSSLRARTIS